MLQKRKPNKRPTFQTEAVSNRNQISHIVSTHCSGHFSVIRFVKAKCGLHNKDTSQIAQFPSNGSFMFLLSLKRPGSGSGKPLEMLLYKCAFPHARWSTSLFPEILNIYSFLSITLLTNPSFSYILMSLYIDLIEHSAQSALKPFGSALLCFPVIQLLYSNPHIYSSLSLIFFSFFKPDTKSQLTFLSSLLSYCLFSSFIHYYLLAYIS